MRPKKSTTAATADATAAEEVKADLLSFGDAEDAGPAASAREATSTSKCCMAPRSRRAPSVSGAPGGSARRGPGPGRATGDEGGVAHVPASQRPAIAPPQPPHRRRPRRSKRPQCGSHSPGAWPSPPRRSPPNRPSARWPALCARDGARSVASRRDQRPRTSTTSPTKNTRTGCTVAIAPVDGIPHREQPVHDDPPRLAPARLRRVIPDPGATTFVDVFVGAGASGSQTTTAAEPVPPPFAAVQAALSPSARCNYLQSLFACPGYHHLQNHRIAESLLIASIRCQVLLTRFGNLRNVYRF